MNINPQPELELTDPGRPTEFIAHTSAEFQSLCDRADFLTMIDGKWVVTRKGEFAIETSERMREGKGLWKVRVRYHD